MTIKIKNEKSEVADNPSEPILVGCCGFGMAQSKYTQTFSSVEVQQTFYQPPQITTLEKWRAQAPNDFDFAIKAWQLITHSSTSPTYRRLKKELTEKEKEQSGSFRLTPIVKEAWNVTLDCAAALDASRILFQCPASFKPTKVNLNTMRKFFESIERPKNSLLCWEPRGSDWTSEIIFPLCDQLKILHVVDPFVTETVTPENFYYRLHGRTGWRHNFDDDELIALRQLMPQGKTGCVYFNNVSMVEDATRFELIAQQKI